MDKKQIKFFSEGTGENKVMIEKYNLKKSWQQIQGNKATLDLWIYQEPGRDDLADFQV